MTLGFILVLLAAALATAFVVAPLLRRDATDPESVRPGTTDQLRELHTQQQALLASLKDLEDDHATDKIGDEDYEALNQRLTAEAIEVMRQLDGAQREQEALEERERQATRPLQYPGAGRPDGTS